MLLWTFLLAAGGIQVTAKEPRPATPWAEVVRGRCGGQQLEIRRPMRPREQSPAILLNGAPPGGNLSTLLQELGEVGAAYRLSVLCHQDDETVELRWVRGLADQSGRVTYRAGSAIFRDSALISSSSAESSALAFWYR